MARQLKFRQIEAFRAVMLTGTTISAAQMLYTTHPSISRLLAQVQAQVAVAPGAFGLEPDAAPDRLQGAIEGW